MFLDYILFISKTYQVYPFSFIGNEIQLQYLPKTGTLGWKWGRWWTLSKNWNPRLIFYSFISGLNFTLSYPIWRRTGKQWKGFRLPFIFLHKAEWWPSGNRSCEQDGAKSAWSTHRCPVRVHVTFLGHVTSESSDAAATAGAHAVMGVPRMPL